MLYKALSISDAVAIVAPAVYVSRLQGARPRRATPYPSLRLLPAMPVNIRVGHFPPADVNGVQYLREPVKLAAEREVRPSFSL
jgi:hypothetical protein